MLFALCSLRRAASRASPTAFLSSLRRQFSFQIFGFWAQYEPKPKRASALCSLLSARLFVRYQLTNVARLDRGDGGRFAQVALSLLPLARENMALESFVPFDLA
jgi:hypothetical protein